VTTGNKQQRIATSANLALQRHEVQLLRAFLVFFGLGLAFAALSVGTLALLRCAKFSDAFFLAQLGDLALELLQIPAADAVGSRRRIGFRHERIAAAASSLLDSNLAGRQPAT
jgi:hypothetical protein